MNRRKFLKTSGALSLPLFFNGIRVLAGDEGLINPDLEALAATTLACGKVLVLIQLNGGNDGLNTVIPLDKYTELTAARSNVLIPSNQVLALNGVTDTGFHPAMTHMRDMYNNGQLCVIRGVSYPNPNFSHFFAQDIWSTGTTTPGATNTGWAGRALDDIFPGYPTGYPSTTEPDPPSILIGGTTALALQGAQTNMGYNSPDPDSLIQMIVSSSGTVPNNDYGTELAFLRLMKDQSNAYALRIKNAYNAQNTVSTNYPASGNSLAEQLKIVARLIGGGLQTPVYIVTHHDNFDTHVNQVASTTTTGDHANMLGDLSEAIAAFQDDINQMGVSNKVTGLTFSEFGRRVMSNNGNGTDHGTAAPMFAFGSSVQGGMIGTSPVLPAVSNTNTQVPMQYDFRAVYSTILQDWLCLTTAEADAAAGGSFSTLPIFSIGSLGKQEIKLKGYLDGEDRVLSFNTNENKSFDYYIIEDANESIQFFELQRLDARRDEAMSTYELRLNQYNHGRQYYRIRGILKSGEEVVSNVLKMNVDKHSQKFSVFPNPIVDHTINMEFYDEMEGNIEVSILAVNGSTLYYNQFPPSKTVQFSVPAMFDSHVLYLLKVVVDGNIYTEKVLFE